MWVSIGCGGAYVGRGPLRFVRMWVWSAPLRAHVGPVRCGLVRTWVLVGGASVPTWVCRHARMSGYRTSDVRRPESRFVPTIDTGQISFASFVLTHFATAS